VRGHPRGVHTTTNGGARRLLALLEFSEDRYVGQLPAVNAKHTRSRAGRWLNRHLLQHIRAGGRTRRLIRVLVTYLALRLPQQLARQPCYEEEPAMTKQDTAELVRRAAKGDELAWRQIIDQHGPSLRRVSSAYQLGEAEAADAVATVWLKLVENIGSLRDGSSVPGWLMSTLRTECLARVSERSRERPLADFAGVEELADVIDFDRWLLDADRRQTVQRAMTKLSEQQRQLLGMLFADPTPSYAEISANLAIPIDSIGPTRCRLLDKLRDAMVDEGWELASAA
jgi:RNA polymerase sigma factor (sigma-70 family)